MSISESDWKKLRQLHEVALQRYCDQVLRECRYVIDQAGDSPHERFLELYQLLYTRNRELAGAFDDLRRSTAIARLAAMRRLGVVTDDDLSTFSVETRVVVQAQENM